MKISIMLEIGTMKSTVNIIIVSVLVKKGHDSELAWNIELGLNPWTCIQELSMNICVSSLFLRDPLV